MIRFDNEILSDDEIEENKNRLYINSLFKLRNNSLFILLNKKFISEFGDIDKLYFKLINQVLYISLKPSQNSIARTVQKVGKNMKYRRVPIPCKIRNLLRLNRFNIVNMLKNENEEFICYFEYKQITLNYIVD